VQKASMSLLKKTVRIYAKKVSKKLVMIWSWGKKSFLLIWNFQKWKFVSKIITKNEYYTKSLKLSKLFINMGVVKYVGHSISPWGPRWTFQLKIKNTENSHLFVLNKFQLCSLIILLLFHINLLNIQHFLRLFSSIAHEFEDPAARTTYLEVINYAYKFLLFTTLCRSRSDKFRSVPLGSLITVPINAT